MQGTVDDKTAALATGGMNEDGIFINFVHPNDSQTRQTKKSVRSQAARSSAAARKATIAAKHKRAGEGDADVLGESIASVSDTTDKPHTVTVRNANLYKRATSSSAGLLSVLGQGRVDPFYPTTFATSGVWHASFPRLIDICKRTWPPFLGTSTDLLADLGSIAPPVHSLENDVIGYDRRLLRQDLWPDLRTSSSLFFANILVAAFHDSFQRGEPPDSTFVAWTRGMAIRNINESLARDRLPSNSTIAAVGILAAFELEFGDNTTFDTHLRGMSTMITLRGGLDAPDIPTVVRNIVLSAGFDLPMFAGLQPYFRPAKLVGMEAITDQRPGPLPPAFRKLKDMCVLQPTMLVLVSEVSTLALTTPYPRDVLHISERLATWNSTKFLAVDNCPVQSPLEDGINSYAHFLIRAALMCIVSGYWRKVTGDDQTRRPGYDPQWLLRETQTLRPEALAGTVYAELTLWALFVICGKIPYAHPRLWIALKRTADAVGKSSWPDVASTLDKHFLLDQDLQKEYEVVWTQLKVLASTGQMSPGQGSRYDTSSFAIRSEKAVLRELV